MIATETNGSSPKKDVILSISAFSVVNNSILIGDCFETIIAQFRYFHDNGISNEFTLQSKMIKMAEVDAIQAFIEFIGNSVLVGHNVDLDVEMINAALERLDCGRLKNEALDINIMYKKLHDITNKDFSLKDLCAFYKIPNDGTNSSSENAYANALLFLKLKSRLHLE